MMSHDVLNLSLNRMFALPENEMLFFLSDKTDSAHDSHIQSSSKAADQHVVYLMFKTNVEYLSRTNLAVTVERYQIAMKIQLVSVLVQTE